MSPPAIPPFGDPWDRRQILKLMAAGMALGGVSGCDSDADVLAPAVVAAPGMVPGLSDFYSSASVIGGHAEGILVRHRDGRPVKVEGNPDHPASLGATDIFAQAMLLDFYDPDRAHGPANGARPSSWPHFLAALQERRGRMKDLRILTGTVTSPSLAAQIARLPGARWHQWEAVSRDAVRAGARIAYGRPVEMVPRTADADVILAIDSDLLSSAPGHLAFARGFASRRNPARTGRMSRVYAVESAPTLTGMAADHRFAVGPSDLHAVLTGLAGAILRNEPAPDRLPWLAAIVNDLKAHRGGALVHIGPDQAPEAHALVHAINEALGGRGHCYDLLPSAEAAPLDQRASLTELVRDMQAGKVDALLILDGNPVFTAPADLGFEEALKRVPFSVNLAAEPDETSAAATWHIPKAHPFEAWSDARAFDGSLTLIQPQSLPLHGGKSAHEMVALFAGEEMPDAKALLQAGRDEAAWHRALVRGVVDETAAAPIGDTLRREAGSAVLPEPPQAPTTVLFRPDPQILDGRFANNAWLQELPRPLTKLTWDNPLLIPPGLAQKLDVGNGDRVALGANGETLEVPVWIQPGQSEDCVVALFGYGRRRSGTAGEGAGFDFYRLRHAAALAQAPADLRKIAGRFPLASTDRHALMSADDGELARSATLAAFLLDPKVMHKPDRPPVPSLYQGGQPPRSEDTAWGMSIDLNACIGCNACVVACQAENNVPVVGKDQVMVEREMHWLRIDRHDEAGFQPVLCMQCEEAPCEVVCPVGATVHDEEGLNGMVYNRCVGTRFCSNNCPYKVRRFNYLAYTREERRPAESRNPDVTARGRGVMEKCTFCVQRIAEARIQADIENRPVRDGEFQTACQAACPTRAFTFGNIRDPESDVSRRKASPLSYAMLGELNTRPRVTYEGRILNESDDLKGRGT